MKAQDFLTRGKIEYEIKKNNKRIYSDEERGRSAWIASLPEFETSYFELTFAWNRMLYVSGSRKGNQAWRLNENGVYTDLDLQKQTFRREFFSDLYGYDDSVRKVKWRIENETRKIAGFECRKAIGVIYDSVYVVAFYSPEIIPQGGPECFSGLPGMILGMAIPRYNTTWFATKIEIANIDESKILPPAVKKGKLLNKSDLRELLYKKYQEVSWGKNMTREQVMDMLRVYIL